MNFAGQLITHNPFAVSEIEKLKTILHKGVMDSIRTSFTGKDLEGTINTFGKTIKTLLDELLKSNHGQPT
jgi:hypothetical protein